MTHIILRRWCYSHHYVALSDAFPGCCLLGCWNGHSQVPSPRPEHRWIRQRHVDVVTVLGQVGLPDGLNKRIQWHRSSPTQYGWSRYWSTRTHLINDPARHTHPVENGHIDDGGHSPIVDGLRAVGPHVGTLCQVNVAGRETGRNN